MYNFDGCQNEYYSSILISHQPIEIANVRNQTVAINSINSMSGHFQFYTALGSEIADTVTKIYTGGHVDSIKVKIHKNNCKNGVSQIR